MQNRDADRYGGSSSNAYSPNLTRPGSRAGGSRRTALKIALCLVLPPVGLVYIWGTGSFRLARPGVDVGDVFCGHVCPVPSAVSPGAASHRLAPAGRPPGGGDLCARGGHRHRAFQH